MAEVVLDLPEHEEIRSGSLLVSTELAPTNIKSYFQLLCQRGKYAELESCQIVTLKHYKSLQRKSSQHEHIVLKMEVSRPSKVHVRYISIHRAYQPTENGAVKAFRFLPMTQPKYLVKAHGVPSSDTISISPENPYPEESTQTANALLYTLTFPPHQRPTVIDVVALAQSLLDLAPKYQLYRLSCYWHARKMYDIFKKDFSDAKVDPGARADLRGKWNGQLAVTEDGKYMVASTEKSFRKKNKIEGGSDSDADTVVGGEEDLEDDPFPEKAHAQVLQASSPEPSSPPPTAEKTPLPGSNAPSPTPLQSQPLPSLSTTPPPQNHSTKKGSPRRASDVSNQYHQRKAELIEAAKTNEQASLSNQNNVNGN